MSRLLQAWDLGLSDVELRELTHSAGRRQPIQVLVPFWCSPRWRWPDAPLAFTEESSGTQSAFVLLSRLLPVLAEGGLAVIDEFEADLHPHMLEPVLDLFAHPETNPTPSPTALHLPCRRGAEPAAQIAGDAGKDARCQSTAAHGQRGRHPDRRQLYAKYMAGAYGAVPQFLMAPRRGPPPRSVRRTALIVGEGLAEEVFLALKHLVAQRGQQSIAVKSAKEGEGAMCSMWRCVSGALLTTTGLPYSWIPTPTGTTRSEPALRKAKGRGVRVKSVFGGNAAVDLEASGARRDQGLQTGFRKPQWAAQRTSLACTRNTLRWTRSRAASVPMLARLLTWLRGEARPLG